MTAPSARCGGEPVVPSVEDQQTAPCAQGEVGRRAPDWRRQRSFEFGVRSEREVAHFLRAGGYEILAVRERVGNSEVDLIVAKGDTVAFVEVKARRRGWDGWEAVDSRKQRRICTAANEWLGSNPCFGSHTIRFDIALVWPGGRIDYLENAFEDIQPEGYIW